MAKKYSEMTDEEKRDAFDTWAANKEKRQASSKAKRAAVQALIAAHKDEFNKLVKSEKVKVK